MVKLSPCPLILIAFLTSTPAQSGNLCFSDEEEHDISSRHIRLLLLRKEEKYREQKKKPSFHQYISLKQLIAKHKVRSLVPVKRRRFQ